MAVYQVCPLLLPADSKRLSYSGFISVAERSFFVSIALPANRSLQDARIDVDWKLKNILKGYEHIIKKRLSQSENLPSFLIEFKSLLNQILTSNGELTSSLAPPTYYSHLIKEIDNIGWNKILHVDQKFQDVKIATRDQNNREHVLTVHLSDKYPIDPPLCNAVLPLPFEFNWSSLSCTLSNLVKHFEETLIQYQLFWDAMDEIDNETWILEPEAPSYSCIYRRIVIDNSLSVHVTVDPLKPLEVPEFVLLGPDGNVSELKRQLYSRLNQWNTTLSLLTNLQNMLSTKFPSKSSTNKEEFTTECGICYAHRHLASGTTPDIVCSNTHCVQMYHKLCLHEWFKSLTTTRENFRLLFGECPYCNQSISISSDI